MVSRVDDHGNPNYLTPQSFPITHQVKRLSSNVERTEIASRADSRGDIHPRFASCNCEAAAGFRPRLYCRGEQPMTLLKAVLKALSDS